MEQRGEVEQASQRGRRALCSRSAPADQLVQPRDAQRGHQLAHLLGQEHEVAHHVLGRAGEAPAKLGILGRDPDRAGVEVADAHHHAAGRDQRRGREGELLGPQQRADEHVAAGAKAAVHLEPHPVAQAVSRQHLLGLGKAELPRQPGVLERRERRGAGAAVVAGDDDVIGPGLGDAGCDRADAGLGDELDRDDGGRVHACAGRG